MRKILRTESVGDGVLLRSSTDWGTHGHGCKLVSIIFLFAVCSVSDFLGKLLTETKINNGIII